MLSVRVWEKTRSLLLFVTDPSAVFVVRTYSLFPAFDFFLSHRLVFVGIRCLSRLLTDVSSFEGLDRTVLS